MIVIPQHKQAMTPMKTAYEYSHQWMMVAGRSISQKRIGMAILAFLALAGSAFAQGTVMPVPRQTWLTNSGAPAANYRLCTFVAGTSTLSTTYTTAALNVANANPLVLDSAGRGTVFLTPGSTYKFILKDSTTTTCVPDTGTTIWSVDNVSAVPASNVSVDVDGTAGESLAAGKVVYLSDGSGARNAGQWYLADADLAYASMTPQIGIVPTAIASGATGSIRIAGRSTALSGLTTGGSYFISATAGDLTATAPTNARYVGQADSTTALIISPNPRPVGAPAPPCGRLTLTSNTPVTITDVTAATTLYYTPYGGCNQISLFTGTAWSVSAFAQLSIAVPATTATMYDVWAYDNAGTVALEVNSTTRTDNTGLTAQNGAYVKTGAVTRLYLGSFRTTGVSGQTEDSFANRLVWNYYHRVQRGLRVLETTDSWTYSTDSWRQVNNSAANQVAAIVGVAEVLVRLTAQGLALNSTGGTRAQTAIGMDSTSAYVFPQTMPGTIATSTTAIGSIISSFETYPAVGYHYFAWMERAQASGTTTFYGDNGNASIYQAGVFGFIEG